MCPSAMADGVRTRWRAASIEAVFASFVGDDVSVIRMSGIPPRGVP